MSAGLKRSSLILCMSATISSPGKMQRWPRRNAVAIYSASVLTHFLAPRPLGPQARHAGADVPEPSISCDLRGLGRMLLRFFESSMAHRRGQYDRASSVRASDVPAPVVLSPFR